MDDDVAAGEGSSTLVIEAEAVLADVAGDGPDAARYLRSEGVAQLGSKPIKAVISDDLAGQSGRSISPPTGTNQYGDLGLGNAAQDAFDQRSAQKAGGAGNEETLRSEVLADWHEELFTIRRRFCLPFGK